MPLLRAEVEPPGEQHERAREPRLHGPADRPGPPWVRRPGQAARTGYGQQEPRRDQQAADEAARQHQRGGTHGQQRQRAGDPAPAARCGGRRGGHGGLSGGQHREEDHRQPAGRRRAAGPPGTSCPGRSAAPPRRRCPRAGPSPAAIRPPRPAPASVRRWSPASRCWCSPVRRAPGRRGGRRPVPVVRWPPRSRSRRRWAPPPGPAATSAAPGRPGWATPALLGVATRRWLARPSSSCRGVLPAAGRGRHLPQLQKVPQCAAERGGHPRPADLQSRTRTAGQPHRRVEAWPHRGRARQHGHLADRDRQRLRQPQPVRVGAGRRTACRGTGW